MRKKSKLSLALMGGLDVASTTWAGVAPLVEAMHYGTLLGGKRLRPFLVYATGEMFAVSPQALIVGTESAIYRLTGADIGAASMSQIADFGAVRGAGVRVDASVFPEAGQSVGVVFAAHGGFCFVGADGGVANLSGARFRPGRFISGSAAFSRKPGNHSVVFTIRK